MEHDTDIFGLISSVSRSRNSEPLKEETILFRKVYKSPRYLLNMLLSEQFTCNYL